MEDAQATSPETEVQTPPSQDAPSGPPGFRERGRMRRRARFLRKARELAYRDLGGLVYNLHRLGQRNDPLVLAKLSTLSQIDSELRTLEAALAEHQPLTVLRDAGIAACPRCAAIHGSEDRFCPNCGLAMDRRA
ncbi:MAG: zinc ribbon domain-containing protein, partial [Solirubrobacteraceae bacterium]